MTVRTSRRLTRLAMMSSAATIGLAAGAGAAAQETLIEDERTTPILTSVVSDPTIRGEDARVVVSDESALVIDADATVNQDGVVLVGGDAEDVAAVRITGDVTGSYAQAGTIDVDTGLDTIVLGAAQDFPAGRYGFLLEEAATFTGPITFADGSSVLLEGSSGAAIAILGTLEGDLTVAGTAAATGAGSAGVLLDGTITGDVTFDASAIVRGTGLGADGLRVGSDAGVDRLVFGGSARATGYTDGQAGFFTTTSAAEEGVDDADQSALSASGSAIAIGADLEDGFAIAQGALSVRGSGAGLAIGDGVTLGLRDDDETTDADEATRYGVDNAGTISAQGVVAGVSATGISIGSATIEGGVRTGGGIDVGARGLDADATGIIVADEAEVARIDNDGLIQVTATSDLGDAVAIRDLSGSVASITNTGTISSRLADFVIAQDDDPNTPDDDSADGQPTGRRIAIDLSANESGVAIVNTSRTEGRVDEEGNPVLDADGNQVRDTASVGAIGGDVLTGSGDDSFLSDAGFVEGDVLMGDGDDRFELKAGSTLFGDLLLGEGDDDVLLTGRGTRIAGRIGFGGDAGSLTLTDGAVFAGTLSEAEGAALTVGGDSLLLLSAGEDISVGSLATTAASEEQEGALIAFTVSQDGTDVATLDVAGDVDLAGDTRLRTLFGTAFNQAELTTTLIRTGGAFTGDLDALTATLAETGSFLFDQRLSLDDDSLVLTIDRKEADQVGLTAGTAPAYAPVLAALVAANEDAFDGDGDDAVLLRRADPDLGAAVFNVRTQDEFLDAFNQFLGTPLDAPLAYARTQNSSVTSLVTARVESLREGFGRERTAWLQEESFFVDRAGSDGERGFDGGGFVIALGLDSPLGPIDTVGITGSIASARFDEEVGNDFPIDQLTYSGGLYAADRIGGLLLDGRVSYGTVSSESERVVIVGQTISESGERRSVTGEWDGTQLAAHGRVRYEAKAGEWDVIPFASLDYLSLDEDGYTEEGSPVDRNIALTVQDREATSLRGNVGLIAGRTYELTPSRFDTSIPGIVAPRLTAAWSQELDGDDLEATYAFQGGEAFTLTQEKESGAAIVGADLLYENQYAKLSGGVSGTFGEDVNAYTLRLGIGLKW